MIALSHTGDIIRSKSTLPLDIDSTSNINGTRSGNSPCSTVKLRRTSQNDETTSTTGDDHLAISGCSRFKGYRRKRLIRVKVLKMLSPRRSDSESTAGGSKDDENGAKAFLSTGRTGRRNALPDIHGRHAATGISDLPDRFGELSTEADRSMNVAGRESNQPSMSKQHVG